MPVFEEGPYVPHYFGEDVTHHYRTHRGWVTAAVHHSVAWPQEDVLVHYDDEDFFIRGAKGHDGANDSACISIRTTLMSDVNQSLAKIYRFASILGWYLRGYVDVVGHVSGSHAIKYTSGKSPFMPLVTVSPQGFDCNYMPIIRSENARRALAFWREGKRLQSIHDGYAFLSFYKVIESQFAKGGGKGEWINQAVLSLPGKAGERVAELQRLGIDLGPHIFESGRCAVAHASLGREIIDPDVPQDRIRLGKDLCVIEALAEKYIREELGIPDEQDVYRNRDRIKPLYSYIDPETLETLRSGGSAGRRGSGLNGVRVAISTWPNSSGVERQDMVLRVLSAHEGVVRLVAENVARSLFLEFLISFTEKKICPDLVESGCSGDAIASKNEMISFLRYQKEVLAMGTIEIRLPNGAIVSCDPVIPVNIDIGRTFKDIDQQIELLQGVSGK